MDESYRTIWDNNVTKENNRPSDVKGQRIGKPEARQELARQVTAELEEFSLRDLSEKLKVSHNALWRLVNGESKMRASTLRAIREGLDQFKRELPAEGQLAGLVRSLPGLNRAQRSAVERPIAMAILEVYLAADLDQPGWLRRIAKGRRGGD